MAAEEHLQIIRQGVARTFEHFWIKRESNSQSLKAPIPKSNPQLALAAPPLEVNFFNAICRLLRYEGRSSAGISDPLVWIDSSVFAESGSVGTGLNLGS
jgi:hypothetical protein